VSGKKWDCRNNHHILNS